VTKKRGGVLDDHRKIGNRLKSPWVTQFDWQFVSYIDESLPEIILLGLLNDAHGYARGAELSFALSNALLTIGDESAPLLSFLGECSAANIQQIAAGLGNDLADVRVAAAPLLAVLPEHPLSGFGKASIDKAECLLRLRECVDRLYDRDSTTACAAMANLYYAQARAGKIHIAHGLRVPNLDAIINDPDSDDASHARSAVRMLVQMIVGHRREEQPTEWPSLFWNRCYLASDCDVEQ